MRPIRSADASTTTTASPPSSSAAERSARLRRVAWGGALVALSIGAPNACVGVSSGDTASTSSGDGSWGNPIVVTRDNLAMGGYFQITNPSVRATVSSQYLSDGRWTNLTGSFDVYELRRGESGGRADPYVQQITPVLPDQNVTGPGSVKYGTRAGVLVHGNEYQLNVSASDPTEGLTPTTPVYVTLSNDVLVVPVVVISWKPPAYLASSVTYRDETYLAKNMLDYNPLFIPNESTGTPGGYFRPDNSEMLPLRLLTKDPLKASDVSSPDPTYFTRPDAEEIPPDDIWTQCGIQFQVIAQFQVDLASGWAPGCSVNTLDVPGNTTGLTVPQKVKALLAGDPSLRDYLVDDLQPVYVNYAPLDYCAPQGFVGSTPADGNVTEISYRRYRSTTAHELGHTLGLVHDFDAQGVPVEGNLMRVDASAGERALTPAQCSDARANAAQFSSRYDQYNINVGRTYSATPPPPPTTTSSADQDGGSYLGLPPGSSGGTICCLAGGAVSLVSSCAGTTVAASECAEVCCTTGASGIAETAYLCAQQGGSPENCFN